MEVYIYSGSISRDFRRPLWSVHLYTSSYILFPSGIVLPSNTEVPSILGMSRGLVHVAARCFRLGTPGCGRNLFHREFLSDIRVQRILQSSSAKWHPAGNLLVDRTCLTCPKILEPLTQKAGQGFSQNSWSTNKSSAKNFKKLWAFKWDISRKNWSGSFCLTFYTKIVQKTEKYRFSKSSKKKNRHTV
jgi:hypothetical protein